MRLFAAIMITGQCHEALAGTLEVMKQSGISGRFVRFGGGGPAMYNFPPAPTQKTKKISKEREHSPL